MKRHKFDHPVKAMKFAFFEVLAERGTWRLRDPCRRIKAVWRNYPCEKCHLVARAKVHR